MLEKPRYCECPPPTVICSTDSLTSFWNPAPCPFPPTAVLLSPLVQSALKRQRQLEPSPASAPADPPASAPKKPVPVAPKTSKPVERPAPQPPPPPSLAAATSCGKPDDAGAGNSPGLTGSGGRVDGGKGGEARSVVRGGGANSADADLDAGGRLIRKRTPTKFLSSLHSMLISGNSQIWWERETGARNELRQHHY